MFKFEEIRELIRLVGSTHVTSVEIQRGDLRLRIEGGAGPAPATVPVVTPSRDVALADSPEAFPGAEADEADGDLHRVTSPIVGTFYRAPNPDAEPYAKVGDGIDKGQVLCIVEAMKLMNEIESDVSGTIVKIVPENAEAVEFGSTLFLLRPA